MQNLVLGASNVKRYCECQHSPVLLSAIACMEKSMWTQTSTCIVGQQSKRTDCSYPGIWKEEKKKPWSLKICNQIRHCSMGHLHKFKLKATLHYLCWNSRDTDIWLEFIPKLNAKWIKSNARKVVHCFNESRHNLAFSSLNPFFSAFILVYYNIIYSK